MRAVIQRVSSSSVISDGVPTGAIGQGLMILLGVSKGDEKLDAELLAAKIAKLRIFSDENGKMNRSVLDVGGAALVLRAIRVFCLAASSGNAGGNRGFWRPYGAFHRKRRTDHDCYGQRCTTKKRKIK